MNHPLLREVFFQDIPSLLVRHFLTAWLTFRMAASLVHCYGMMKIHIKSVSSLGINCALVRQAISGPIFSYFRCDISTTHQSIIVFGYMVRPKVLVIIAWLEDIRAKDRIVISAV